MLKQLNIHNIILIEQETLSFHSGLNILTGETGSGKSAIMHGLSLVIGERADTAIIRRGCEKGSIEAIFEIPNPEIHSLLCEGGIDYEPGQEIIIRRDITTTGKGRIFINHQFAQLSFLRQLGPLLVQIVGQHSNQKLFSVDYHRECLDLFGNLHSLVNEYQKNYELEKKLKEKLHNLIQLEAHRLREIDRCERELKELEEANLQLGEDEELFLEHSFHAQAEEVLKKVSEINQTFSGERVSFLVTLNRHKQTLESLASFDKTLSPLVLSFQNAFLELQEISYSLKHYQNQLHFDPHRLQIINDRMALITQLKRKYGASLHDVLHYREETDKRLKELREEDCEIEKLQQEVEKCENTTNQLARLLTEKRREWASQLEKDLTIHLHSLNMSQAHFIIQLCQQKRNSQGDDRVEFLLAPNIGEHQISLKEGASGGELSRVLLALQTLLAGKDIFTTLLFDEIDANIGGETATIIGDKLKKISCQQQVICITHFPQVASQADHHLQISKEEKEGRTHTRIQELNLTTRSQELSRMAGLKKLTSLFEQSHVD